jgi:hypothetical protein
MESVAVILLLGLAIALLAAWSRGGWHTVGLWLKSKFTGKT